MVIPEQKIKKIAKFWNSFVFRYRIIQKEINWTDEVKTNYFGDILNFFLDTFELLDINTKKANTDSAIIYLTGILQIIYAQQDLIDELLYIFKLPGSKLSDVASRT